MYQEGSYKGVFAILFATLLVICICYWHQALFILKFLWDLLVINLTPFLQRWHLMKPA